MRQIYSLIFRSTDLQIGQTERANLLNKSINGRRRHTQERGQGEVPAVVATRRGYVPRVF